MFSSAPKGKIIRVDETFANRDVTHNGKFTENYGTTNHQSTGQHKSSINQRSASGCRSKWDYSINVIKSDNYFDSTCICLTHSALGAIGLSGTHILDHEMQFIRIAVHAPGEVMPQGNLIRYED